MILIYAFRQEVGKLDKYTRSVQMKVAFTQNHIEISKD